MVNMKTVLVTGGAGFIGSHVVDELIRLENKVIVLDDLSGGFEENVHKRAKLIKGSITDLELIESLFVEYKFEYVFHLAAYAAEGLSHFIKRFNYENNLIGSVNLINASVNHNVKCFVFTSSIAVYGAGQPPMTEDMIPAPEDPYGIAKYAVEQELKVSNEMFGLNSIIFRPHNVYGERQNIGDKYRNVVGIFMNQIMKGEPLTIFGDGAQARAFTYIKDISSVIANSIFVKDAYNKIFNVGTDTPITVNDLAEEVCKLFNVEKKTIHFEERNEVKHAFSDHSKLRRYFDCQVRNSLSEGLDKMAKWVKEVGVRQSKDFKNIEIEKNLPKSWLTE
jgi:UDP-glucose 4-epimerase